MDYRKSPPCCSAWHINNSCDSFISATVNVNCVINRTSLDSICARAHLSVMTQNLYNFRVYGVLGFAYSDEPAIGPQRR